MPKSHREHIAEIDAQIGDLEQTRGTDKAPPNLDAVLAQLRHKRQWHELRESTPHHNTGTRSLYERDMRGRPRLRPRRFPYNETPLVTLSGPPGL